MPGPAPVQANCKAWSKMIEFLLLPVALLVCFAAAVALIFYGLKLVYVIRGKHGLLPYIFYFLTFGNIVLGLTCGRNLSAVIDPGQVNANLNVELPPSPYYVMCGRVVTVLVLFAACQRIVRQLMHYRNKPDAPVLLIVTLWFFFFTNVVTTAAFSAHPSLEHYYVYLVLVGTASLLLNRGEEEISICALRNILFVFLLISVAVIPWNLGLVMDNKYVEGIVPGFTYRYSGLASHPNSMGLITTLFLLCLWNHPFGNRFINRSAWIAGCSSLLLTQSKTSWIGFLLCMFCMGYFKHGDYLKRRLFDYKNPVLSILFIFTVMTITGTLLAVVMFGNIGGKIDSFFASSTGSSLMTMTGRTQIWEIALDEWRRSPVFGYGLTIWDEAHRAKIGMPMAVTAHSQFYQTLASSGVVGMAGLIVYVAALLWFTLKTAKSSQGLTLAIFFLLFLRSISEVSIAITGQWDFVEFAHLLLLTVIGGQFKLDSIKKANNALMTYQKFSSSRGFN